MNWKVIIALLITSSLFAQQPPDLKEVTFDDITWMIANDGFILKNDYSAEPQNKCATKQEISDAIFIQNTIQIQNRAANQLVPYVYLDPPTGGTKPAFRTEPGDNVQDNADKGYPTTPMLFNGTYDLPIVGDPVYDENDNPYNPSVGLYQFSSYMVYPQVDPHGAYEANIKVESGVVTWFGWVSNSTVTPVSLSTVNDGIRSFDFSWFGETKFLCPRYRIEYDPGAIGPDGGNRYTLETINNPNTTVGTITRSYTSISDGNIYCTCMANSALDAQVPNEYLDKEAGPLAVDVDELYEWGTVYNLQTFDSGQLCNSGGVSAGILYGTAPLNTSVPAGTQLYTDVNGTSPYSPAGGQSLHNTGGGSGSYGFMVLSNGQTSGVVTQCP